MYSPLEKEVLKRSAWQNVPAGDARLIFVPILRLSAGASELPSQDDSYLYLYQCLLPLSLSFGVISCLQPSLP